MFIWPRDCLEAYLIVPSAIQRILQEEVGETAPKVGEVQAAVSSILAAMNEETLDRVATRMQDVEWRFNHNRIEPAQANPMARAEMEKLWKTANNPLALASGKLALSRIRAKIQEKWKVSFGNARIIEAMQPDEVHQDVKSLFSKAVKALYG